VCGFFFGWLSIWDVRFENSWAKPCNDETFLWYEWFHVYLLSILAQPI
jgi:hypothetical protein